MMSRQVFTVVLFLVVITVCRADENSTEIDDQCLDDIINWCNNLYANDGVSQLIAESHFGNSSVEIVCIWDENGENCTKNGKDWFFCSVGGTLVYKGNLVSNGTLVYNGTGIIQGSMDVVDVDACQASVVAVYGLGPETSAMVIHNVIHSFFLVEMIELAIEELRELEYYEIVRFL